MTKKIIALLVMTILLLLTGCQPKEDAKETNYTEVSVSIVKYNNYRAIENELGKTIIIGEVSISEDESGKIYSFKIDNTYADGVKYRIVSEEEYKALQDYQNETGIQIIYPTVKIKDRPTSPKYSSDGNIYYVTEDQSASTPRPKFDKDGKFILNYWKYEEETKSTLIADYNSLRIEGEDGFTEDGKTYFYAYSRKVMGGIEVRVACYEYNKFIEQYYALGTEQLLESEYFE